MKLNLSIDMSILKEDYRKIGIVFIAASIAKLMAPDLAVLDIKPLLVLFSGIIFYLVGIINTGENNV